MKELTVEMIEKFMDDEQPFNLTIESSMGFGTSFIKATKINKKDMIKLIPVFNELIAKECLAETTWEEKEHGLKEMFYNDFLKYLPEAPSEDQPDTLILINLKPVHPKILTIV